ncbi:MAG: hypothetical protein AAFW73_18345 [Bacteroidota bacterium]
MMNKFLLGCIFLILGSGELMAQKVSVSDDVSLRNDDGYAIIGRMKNRILLFRFRGNEYLVQAFDHKLRTSWSKEIQLERKNPKVIEIIPDRDDFTVIYQHRKKSHLVIRANKYDAAANLVDSTEIVDLGASWYVPPYSAVLSEDRQKMVLYAIEKQTEIIAYSFDLQNMQLLWSNRFKPANLNEPHDHEQIIVDNQGNFYFVMEKENRRSRQEEHRYEVYRCNQDIQTITVPAPEYQTYDISFAFDNLNQSIVAAGLYSEKNRGRANGYFFLRVELQADNKYLLRYEEFPEAFLSSISGRGVDEEKGLSECNIQQVVLRRDGGILFVAERNHRLERRSTGVDRGYVGRDGGRYIIDYYHDDLFAYSIHPDGTTHWKTVMHKKQYSQDDNAAFSSFFLLKTPTALRLIFNDEIRNENTVSEYVIRGDGNFDRNSVMSTESQNIRLRFRDALQVGANALIIPSERRNRLRLVLLEY